MDSRCWSCYDKQSSVTLLCQWLAARVPASLEEGSILEYIWQNMFCLRPVISWQELADELGVHSEVLHWRCALVFEEWLAGQCTVIFDWKCYISQPRPPAIFSVSDLEHKAPQWTRMHWYFCNLNCCWLSAMVSMPYLSPISILFQLGSQWYMH